MNVADPAAVDMGSEGTHLLAGRAAPPHSRLTPLSTKVEPRHWERQAVVYVRQSSVRQVREHRESRERQYALVDRAAALGWPVQRIVVIDDDQGQSGATAEGRRGFQELLVAVGLDRVGLILALEMSRLARSSKDWHHLLEVCAIFGTLLADADGVYDPNDPNDRLLLGLKGTLSEAELHTMRGRLLAGQLNKARRGELFSRAPLGYVRRPDGGLALDPDEQAQSVVRLIFEKFAELKNVHAVLRYLARHQIRLPIRVPAGPNRGELQWRGPCQSTLQNLLRHPIYAGAYSYGRRRVDRRRRVSGRPGTGRIAAPREQWPVLLRDHLPAYLSWEQYVANQCQLEQNRSRRNAPGAVRQGTALLAGIVVCGRCGHRLRTMYATPRNHPRYVCCAEQNLHGGRACQSLVAGPLDELVSRQVLRALDPAALELSLQAAENVQQERDRLHQHWRQRLERGRYETDRVRRQYQAVEPEHRLVARELERQWEQRLSDQRELEAEYELFCGQTPVGLSDEERSVVRALAADVARLWSAPQTTSADRRTIVRHLVERVVVEIEGRSERLEVSMEWAGGFQSRHRLRRPVGGYGQLADYDRLLARAHELRAAGLTGTAIAETLNRDGFRAARGRAFHRGTVYKLFARERPPTRRNRSDPQDQPQTHEWWACDLARELRMPIPTLHSWRRYGWVHARQIAEPAGRWIYWANPAELDRLHRLRAAPRRLLQQPYPAELTIPGSKSQR